MDRLSYPALVESGRSHLDTSAAFPLHTAVITATIQQMETSLGSADKGSYSGAQQANQRLESVRAHCARFLGTKAGNIFFVANSGDAIKTLLTHYGDADLHAYSPEDHLSLVNQFDSEHQLHFSYSTSGEYNVSNPALQTADVVWISHIHHIYGADNNLIKIRASFPNSAMIVDASQSISRLPINVLNIGCDALFFSSHKVGGLAGVGVLYLSETAHQSRPLIHEPNTIPLTILASLDAALTVLEIEGLNTIESYLALLSARLIDQLSANHFIHFTKGPAQPENHCTGNGIVSFSVDGYSAADVAMILDDHGINVRAGDHCVDPDAVSQDVVRISLHRFTTINDVDTVIEIINKL